ncbi:hypothetical protein FIBSPDRAFT_931456 [Athelia psychrophila]|uniref:Uncharacterized protein n=1 Tax=Athelia psychrophila TaxID=1759441 RepID=A0A166KGT8_9AGAM|nr:hypothetical protein FIBSPDRAFT_931456 [Fibularhizoctonia sp. CBS 109695]
MCDTHFGGSACSGEDEDTREEAHGSSGCRAGCRGWGAMWCRMFLFINPDVKQKRAHQSTRSLPRQQGLPRKGPQGHYRSAATLRCRRCHSATGRGLAAGQYDAFVKPEKADEYLIGPPLTNGNYEDQGIGKEGEGKVVVREPMVPAAAATTTTTTTKCCRR